MVPLWPLLVFAVADAVTVVRLQVHFEQTHSLSLNSTVEYILEFVPRGDEGAWPSRVTLESDGGDVSHPVLLTARQRTGAVTWQLPYYAGDALLYRMERTLCPDSEAGSVDGFCGDAAAAEGFFVHLSSACRTTLAVRLRATALRDWQLPFDVATAHRLTTASPRILHYRFAAGQRYVRLVAESEDDTCATISVQDVACPIPQTLAEVSVGGLRMTMQRSAGAYVSREQFPDGFLVVALLRDRDDVCTGETVADSDWLWNDAVPLLLRDDGARASVRNKTLLFTIKPALSRTQYAWAAVATLLVFLLFYGAFLATVVAQRWTPWARLVGPKAVFAESTAESGERAPDDIHPPVVSFTAGPVTSDNNDAHVPVTSDTNDARVPVTSDTNDARVPVTYDNNEARVPVTSDTNDARVPVTYDNNDARVPVTSDTNDARVPVTSDTNDARVPVTYDNNDARVPVTSDTNDARVPVTSDTNDARVPVTSAMIESHPQVITTTTDSYAQMTFATTSALPSTDDRTPSSVARGLDSSRPAANGPQKKTTRKRRDSTATFDSCDVSERSDSDREEAAPYGLPTAAALNVAVLARRRSRVLRARSDRYLYTLYTVAVFYALPVVQFVAAFQILLNVSGSLDTCYYNFLCAHPAGALSDFNHVYSNLGYVLLGGLFMLQVRRRRSARRAKPRHEDYGIPPHYGLLSTLGAGCMIVGVLSASYHVCPNKLNFQFDTAFMYVLAVISMVKIYQSRHPDVNARAHATFGVLAVLLALVVWGVLGGGALFWGVFTVLHVFTFLLLSLRIYYMGQFRLEKESLQRAARELAAVPKRGVRPLYTARLVMLLIANAVNWLFALYGLFTLAADFASHLLSVLLCNTLMYMVFYLTMKLLHGERPRWYSWLYTGGATAAWAPGLYFFVSGSSSWAATPAQSRHLNHECRLLHFYDSHDLWHLLSAVALYFSFNAMFTWDDGLTAVRRSDIPVF